MTRATGRCRTRSKREASREGEQEVEVLEQPHYDRLLHLLTLTHLRETRIWLCSTERTLSHAPDERGWRKAPSCERSAGNSRLLSELTDEERRAVDSATS